MVSTGEPGRGEAKGSVKVAEPVDPLGAGLVICSAETILFLPFCLAA